MKIEKKKSNKMKRTKLTKTTLKINHTTKNKPLTNTNKAQICKKQQDNQIIKSNKPNLHHLHCSHYYIRNLSSSPTKPAPFHH